MTFSKNGIKIYYKCNRFNPMHLPFHQKSINVFQTYFSIGVKKWRLTLFI